MDEIKFTRKKLSQRYVNSHKLKSKGIDIYVVKESRHMVQRPNSKVALQMLTQEVKYSLPLTVTDILNERRKQKCP